jgi:predicted exporter
MPINRRREGANSLPKAASQRRTLREISNRISTLTQDELDFFIAEADRAEQQALLWLATCRAYRFVREFAVEVNKP